MGLFTALLSGLLSAAPAKAVPLPGPPADARHPGHPGALFALTEHAFECQGRKVWAFLPEGVRGAVPVVSYGHGQALDLEAYRKTLEHLAKKGIAAVFPMYDTGFFDQDWPRMGRDFLTLTRCAIARFEGRMDDRRVIFSGHSKGAYVASIAAGLAGGTAGGVPGGVAPRALVLFGTAGSDSTTLSRIPRGTATTVVVADSDRIVDRAHSERVFRESGSAWRQLIELRSYEGTTPRLAADHFWPLTRRTTFGGGPEGPLHFHGSWKWLVAAAWDLSDGAAFDQPFLYGAAAADKGAPGLVDGIRREFPN